MECPFTLTCPSGFATLDGQGAGVDRGEGNTSPPLSLRCRASLAHSLATIRGHP
jgi:hypothetical protein